jgi:hypothetical protein
MKMRRFFPIVAAAALLFAGCAKENFVEPQVGGKTVLTAGIQTKTLMQNDAEVLWTNGDVINVNGVNSAALALTEPSATAEFTFDAVLEHPYKAVFPASIYKDGSTVTLPAYQTYAEGTFAQNAAPMAAYLEDGSNLGFKNLANVVKLTVKAGADTDKIAFVEFKGNAGEQVAGDFAIDFATMALTPASTADADKTVKLTVAKELTAEGVVMYIVVPAQNYSAGFTVKVVDVQGHYMEKCKASAVELAAGQVYELPAFEFAPTATQLDAEITSAAELNAFIAKYNAGEYPAEAFVKIANEFEFTAEDNAAFESIMSFGGVFDGNGMNIYNFNAGKPLAETVLENAIVKNLTVEGAATVQAVEGSLNMGTFAGALQGGLEHCISKVDYTVTGAQSAGYIAMGALVGRLNAGKISDCSAQGNIVFDENFSITGEETAYIGGLVGRNSNAAGVIDNCQSASSIKYVGTATKNIYIGGVVGHTNGTVSNCQTFSAGEGNMIASGNYVGDIVVDSDAVKYTYIGGVVGIASNTSKIISCTNDAVITTNFTRNGDQCRTMRVAGVVGETAGVLEGVANNANVSMYSSVKTQYLAGVAAVVSAQAKLDGCSSNGIILLGDGGDSDQGGRENYVGGIAGSNSSADISNAINHSSIVVEMIDYDNTNSDTRLYMGGCIGESKAAITGIINKGAVTWNSANGWVPTSMFAMGGIVGVAHADVKNVINSGAVVLNESEKKTGQNLAMGGIIGMIADVEDEIEVTDSENSAEVKFNVTGTARSYKNIYLGGVVGYNSTAALTVSRCDNSGFVYTGITKKTNSVAKYLGGIVGYLCGNSKVEYCNVTSALYHDDFNNEVNSYTKGAVAGGVVGVAVGTQDARIKVDQCVVDNEIPYAANETTLYELAGRRGWLGGIVGYAENTDITNSKCKSNLEGSFYHSGGICAEMVASTASACEVVSNTSSSQTRYAGGFVAKMDATSSIDGCSVHGNITTKSSDVDPVFGCLAGLAPSGAVVSNCQYKVTLTYTGTKNAVTGVVAEGEPTLTNNTELAE